MGIRKGILDAIAAHIDKAYFMEFDGKNYEVRRNYNVKITNAGIMRSYEFLLSLSCEIDSIKFDDVKSDFDNIERTTRLSSLLRGNM